LSPLEHPNLFSRVHQAAAQPRGPSTLSARLSPPLTYHTPAATYRWTPPISPFPGSFSPSSALSRAHVVGAGGPACRRQPWAPPPCSAGTAGWRPHTLVPHLHHPPVPQNPRAPPYKDRPPASPCTAPLLGDFFPKIHRCPCLEAPWGFSSCCHRNPEEEGKMGGVEKADRRAQAP
jgi:hypothetical protein